MTETSAALHARAALRAVVDAVAGPGPGTEPGGRVRAAVGGAYADLWTCSCLEALEAGAVTAYLTPRLLLDGTDSLASALGGSLHSPEAPYAAYRHHARSVASLVAAPGAAGRARDVAARLPALAAGDDRLARPLTVVRAAALTRGLGELVGPLEEERRRVVERSADPVTAEVRALTDRYALLTAAAACLDGWRAPGGSGRAGGDRCFLVGALSRLMAGLGLASAPGRDWRDGVFRVAAESACRRVPAGV